MTRLLIHVEGETEETFVREVLRPHLCNNGYLAVSARLLRAMPYNAAIVAGSSLGRRFAR